MPDRVPWRSHLDNALHLNRELPYSRYFQVATVRPNGHPANRTVVFRGFIPATDCLTAITDQRSPKIQQIQHTPWAEICWYFPMTREQFRINGPLQIVNGQHPNSELQNAYFKTWQSLSDSARSQFYGPDPGQPYDGDWAGPAGPTSPESPPETFRLLVVNPAEVEHLDLRSQPNTFHHYQLDSDGLWTMERLTS